MFLVAFPVFLIASFGMGLRIFGIFKWEPSSKLVHFFLSLTLGYAFIGQFIYLIGLFHLLIPWLLWLFFIVMLLVNFGIVILFFKDVKWRESFKSVKEAHFLEKTLLDLTVISLLIHAFFSLAPQIHWDANAHHYLVPAYFLSHGGVIDFPDVLFSYYPSLVEMQYLAGMALGGEATANLIGCSHGIIICIGIFAVAILMFSRWKYGIWAGLVFLSTQGIHMHFEGGWNDLGVAMFIIASLLVLFEYGKTHHRGLLFLSSILMGAALASKHYAWIPFMYAFLFLVWDSIIRKKGFSNLLVKCVIYFLTAFSMPFIWYLRSYILTGNPVYPFSVFGLFPTYELEPFVVTSWVNYGFNRNFLSFIAYPFSLMFGTSWIPELTGRLPYLLLLIPISLVYIKKGEVRALWLFTLWTLFIMYFIAPFETRYMLYMVPFETILVGVSVGFILDRTRQIKKSTDSLYSTVFFKVAMPIVFLAFLFPFIINQKSFEHDWKDKRKVILNLEYKDKYLFRQSHNYKMLWWMNNNLPDDSLTLCLEHQLYRLDKPFVTWYGMKVKYPENAVEAWEKNYRHGNTHMYLGEGGMAIAYVLWNIYHLPEDENGYVTFRTEDVLLNLLDKPIPQKKFWILSLSVKRNFERWGFEKIEKNGETWYRVKKDILDDSLPNSAALKLVDLFRDMISRGWIVPLQDDGLNMIVKFDYTGHEQYFN